MAYRDLREFIERLEAAGELRRIGAEVDPELEVAEIANRVVKAGGPALLFENVRGHTVPVLTNHYGSHKRMAWALGVADVEEIRLRIEGLVKQRPPAGLGDKVRAGLELLRLASFAPKTVGSAPCQEVVQDPPDLGHFPALKTWPRDGGRFITLPMVFTRHPETGQRNVGMYRLHIYDERSTGMHWHPHKVGAMHYRIYEKLGRHMPVAVALGGDPAMTYAATAPLPEDIDEVMFAGFLRQQAVELVKCQTCDLEVPADAEVVLEGHVEPGERRVEGPFGDHTGYYSPAEEYPVFHVERITHRRDPIWPATVVGPPPMEDCYMGKATERIFLPLLQMVFPEVVDVNLPIVGVFHNLALVSIRKGFPGHARKVMQGLWGTGQMMFTKVIVVVDEDVNVQDGREVLWKALNSIDPKRDVMFVEGPVDALDHAAPQPLMGSKMGVDATRKWPEEGYEREWPEELKMDEAVRQRISDLWNELGLPGEVNAACA
ncbi:MAG: menaquinone biosynthesis decarboxylase [Armatimonadota bacterium]